MEGIASLWTDLEENLCIMMFYIWNALVQHHVYTSLYNIHQL